MAETDARPPASPLRADPWLARLMLALRARARTRRAPRRIRTEDLMRAIALQGLEACAGAD